MARFLGFLGAAAVLGVAFFLGLFLLAAAFGLMLIGAVVIGARLWWLRRNIRQALEARGAERREETVIEGQYSVVDAGRAGVRSADD
ncbi:hypothetical protein BH24PSE2_BH24PSE2_19530 [soil metagenome]